MLESQSLKVQCPFRHFDCDGLEASIIILVSSNLRFSHCGNRDRLYVIQTDAMRLTPIEELLNRSRRLGMRIQSRRSFCQDPTPVVAAQSQVLLYRV